MLYEVMHVCIILRLIIGVYFESIKKSIQFNSNSKVYAANNNAVNEVEKLPY